MAYDALVERKVAKPRARIFATLTDFGGVGRILPDAVKACECVGSGVGAVRTITLGDGGKVVERLEVAHDQTVFGYSIIENNAIPVENYFAVVILTDTADGGTNVLYGSNWTAKGAPESDVRGSLEGLYNAIIDGVVKLI